MLVNCFIIFVSENRTVLTGLRPNTAYSVVVEARKMQKHDAVNEGYARVILSVSPLLCHSFSLLY